MEEQPRCPRVRLFVALELPAPLRSAIAAWGLEELADPGLRPVAAENLHITLAFLGYRPAVDVERIARVLKESAGPAPRLELLDPEPRPPGARPRLFALPTLSPGAEQMQLDLSRTLIYERLYKGEKRPFWPHVTVAGVPAEGRGSRRPLRVERPPGSLPAALREPSFSGRLTLYRSVLQPSGAHYVPLAQVKLPGARQQRGD